MNIKVVDDRFSWNATLQSFGDMLKRPQQGFILQFQGTDYLH